MINITTGPSLATLITWGGHCPWTLVSSVAHTHWDGIYARLEHHHAGKIHRKYIPIQPIAVQMDDWWGVNIGVISHCAQSQRVQLQLLIKVMGVVY